MLKGTLGRRFYRHPGNCIAIRQTCYDEASVCDRSKKTEKREGFLRTMSERGIAVSGETGKAHIKSCGIRVRLMDCLPVPLEDRIYAPMRGRDAREDDF